MSFWTTKFEKLPIYGWTLVVIVALLIVATAAAIDWLGVF